MSVETRSHHLFSENDLDFLPALKFVWIELTGKCNLSCTHCYADSSPHGSHGKMTRSDWEAVILDAQRSGASFVQFIGGEPTLHPDFSELVLFTSGRGMACEVYTNLLRMTPELWKLFEECEVAIATSFYSLDALAHDRVTTRDGSQARTLRNIREAVKRSIPLRVNIVSVFADQNVEETESLLRSMGVDNIGIDHVRGIGRGAAHDSSDNTTDALCLCGQCATSRAAIDPEGWVYPCIMARWMKIGNVREEPLSEIVNGHNMCRAREELRAAFSESAVHASCGPSKPPSCGPSRPGCGPSKPPSCGPSRPGCGPSR